MLDAASFELEAGRIHAILGDSGAGKTTLVDLITGLVEPETGSVEIVGRSPLAVGDATFNDCDGPKEAEGSICRLAFDNMKYNEQ